MFLNLSKFKSLVKQGYKTKVTIGYINDGLVITSGKWSVWLKNDYIPNKVKAVVMELAGELPAPETVFEVGKSTPEPQIIGTYKIIADMFRAAKEAGKKMIVTPIVLNSSREIRLLQMDHNKAMVGIPEEVFQIIDKSMIDLDIEGEPTGPCCSYYEGPVYWNNSICTVIILPVNIKEKDQEILNSLTNIDFFKQYKEE